MTNFTLNYKSFLIFIFFSIATISNGQNSVSNLEPQYYKVISFGDKINFGNVENTASWTINNLEKRTTVSLNGNQINDYVFQEPGEYQVDFSENKTDIEGCDHVAFSDKMIIKVTSVQLLFNFEKIQFSKQLKKGVNYNDNIITVPVTITTKRNSEKILNAPDLVIAGIGSSLIAKPFNSTIEIKDGTQLLKYKVSGLINKETYLMFDFYDFNNQIQTYNLLQLIN